MNILDFTTEETNLIAIYAEESQTTTVAAITGAMPVMIDEIRKIAASSAAKLAIMNDKDFAEIAFDLAEEDDIA